MNRKAGGVLLVLVILITLSSYVSYATVPDADGDGVPDANDKCPNFLTSSVDPLGCSCEQKTASNCNSLFPGAQCCVPDSNPCTDDCSADNIGTVGCNYADNTNTCPNGGLCRNGQCVPANLVGVLDIANCLLIRGWAFDSDAKSTPIKVRLYQDSYKSAENLVQEITTTELRADVNSAYGTTGPHGFTVPTPAAFRDGSNAHSLSVIAYVTISAESSKAKELTNSPKTLTCSNNQDALSGTTFTAN